MNISQLLDLARQRSGFATDTQLAQALGIAGPNIARFRKGHQFPSDEKMLTLCRLAGVDPHHGLVVLHIWKTQDDVQAVYRSILRKLIDTPPGESLGDAAPPVAEA